jgi:hypothetical protein
MKLVLRIPGGCVSKRRGLGGEMNQALYAHMNNKRKMRKKKKKDLLLVERGQW